MPFWVVVQMGARMRKVDGVGYRPREGAISEVNVGRLIVTNGNFMV